MVNYAMIFLDCIMGKIQQLDEVTINQIAAGEVIDRPASIVKELIENSIDAKSDTINIDLMQGGIDRIVVTDNGTGILPDDFRLVPVRHATSKIKSLSDVYDTQTMGFRGEAIASICHIATVEIASKTSDHPASKLSFKSNELLSIQSTHHPVGTTVTVSQLFQHIPVRRNYLKKPQTEYAAILELIVHFALIHPSINFTLTHNGKETLNTVGIAELNQLVINLYGKQSTPLISIDSNHYNIGVHGLVSSPQHHFSNRSRQLICINNRPVKSPIVQRAVSDAYHELIVPNRFPIAILFISIDNQYVDVNIHPQKKEVKLLHPNDVYQAVKHAIKSKLSHTHFNMADLQSRHPTPTKSTSNNASQTHGHTSQKSPISSPTIPLTIPDAKTFSNPVNIQSFQHPGTFTIVSPIHDDSDVPPIQYLQAFNTYIIFCTTDAVWMIDQHAVHERILYEKFKKSAISSKPDHQFLIDSTVIDLGAHRFTTYENYQSKLTDLGFITEPFGGSQIIIRAINPVFSKASVTDLILNFLDSLDELETDPHLSQIEIDQLQMMSCKAAIKAGDSLNEPEVRQLINDFLNSPDNFTCPHGRPLFHKLTKIDLEKLFKRR